MLELRHEVPAKLGGRAVARDHLKLLLDGAAVFQLALIFYYSYPSPDNSCLFFSV